MNPYVFVVGCPRSGTTLLQRLLDAHPRLAVIDETRWIDHWCTERRGVTAEGFVTGELIMQLLEFPRFAQLGLGREELESLLNGGRPLQYPSFVAGLFDLYGRSRGKPLVGDKTPRYVRSLPTLHEFFPQARFVHLIRDGRETSLSVVNWRKAEKLAETFPTWREHPVATAALWWEWQVRLGREAGPSLGPQLYHEVRYEALVADSAGELEPLCAFLDLPLDEAMLRFHEGRERNESDLSAKSAWLPPTPGLRDWSTQMTGEDVERFEATAGELLDELGYPRAVPEPSAGAGELAAALRDAFTRELRSRGRRLPERW
jgi:sulfotransferase family protein